jgi:uncharacterized membrane protein YbaN (DUF454 family)
VRWALRVVGGLALALGVLGAFVPLIPTTIFLLIALWAFSRSSPRFHRWLYDHPRLGPPLRAWHEHRVISPRAKAAAVGLMAGGLVLAATVFATDGWVVGLAALVLIPVAGFILMQRGAVPEATTRGDV